MSAPLAPEAARVSALRDQLRALYGEQIDEEDFLSAIESETEFPALASRIVRAHLRDEADVAALKALEAQYAARRGRLEERATRLKAMLQDAMETAGLRKLPLPEATLSLSHRGPSVLITDEAAIPAGFKREKVTVTVDKAALKEALGFAPVPGATLSNGGTSLSIRRG